MNGYMEMLNKADEHAQNIIHNIDLLITYLERKDK